MGISYWYRSLYTGLSQSFARARCAASPARMHGEVRILQTNIGTRSEAVKGDDL
jgi:hypothetical protein